MEPPVPPPEDASFPPSDQSRSGSIGTRVRSSFLPETSSGPSQATPGSTHQLTPSLSGGVDASYGAVREYDLMEKMAEGGQGEVWLAMQRSLGRTVAVKRLKKNHVQEDSRGPSNQPFGEIYFRQEAITAARLEHPNIVPIHDLGFDEEGRPLIVMKRVQGQEWRMLLRDDVDRLPLLAFLEKHTRILISVCQAVAFAHSRGIVHRDLKPSQVMIGTFGEVLLMDWGLAMAFGEEAKRLNNESPFSPLVNPACPAGTPHYMAPEQTLQHANRIGPWTDVYLLGGILYHMLTGEAPHRGQRDSDAFERARAGVIDPPELRAPTRDLPIVLCEIATDALAAKPDKRPANVQALIERLEGYLSGADKMQQARELVRSVADRVGRDATYDDLAESLNLLERAIILHPSHDDAVRLQQELLQRIVREAMKVGDLQLARLHAEKLEGGAIRQKFLGRIGKLNEDRQQQQERLRHALASAQRHLQMTQQLLRFVMGEMLRTLKPLGRLDVLRRAAEESLQILEQIGVEEHGAELIAERASAYGVIGDVLNHEGNRQEALDAYAKMRDLLLKLLASYPRDMRFLPSLGQAFTQLAFIQMEIGKNQEAIADFQRAFRVRRHIRGIEGPSQTNDSEIANCLHGQGLVHASAQEFERSLNFQTRSLKWFRRLRAKDPEDQQIAIGLATNLAFMSHNYRDLGHSEPALALMEEALGLYRTMHEAAPDDREILDMYLRMKAGLSYLQFNLGNFGTALSISEEELAARRELANRDHSNIDLARGLGFSRCLQGTILNVIGRIAEAEEILLEEWQFCGQILLRDLSPRLLAATAYSGALLSEVLLVQEKLAEAEDVAPQAAWIGAQALQKLPDNAFFCKAGALAHFMQGRLYHLQGHPDQAAACVAEAERLTYKLRVSGDLVLAGLKAKILLAREDFVGAAPLVAELHARNYRSALLEQMVAESGLNEVI